jgi:hypothetical protein
MKEVNYVTESADTAVSFIKAGSTFFHDTHGRSKRTIVIRILALYTYTILLFAQTMYLFLRIVNNNAINIRALVRLIIEQPPNGNRVVRAILQMQHQRRTQNNALVRVSLIKRLHILRLVVHNDTTDSAQLPASANTVR